MCGLMENDKKVKSKMLEDFNLLMEKQRRAERKENRKQKSQHHLVFWGRDRLKTTAKDGGMEGWRDERRWNQEKIKKEI